MSPLNCRISKTHSTATFKGFSLLFRSTLRTVSGLAHRGLETWFLRVLRLGTRNIKRNRFLSSASDREPNVKSFEFHFLKQVYF